MKLFLTILCLLVVISGNMCNAKEKRRRHATQDRIHAIEASVNQCFTRIKSLEEQNVKDRMVSQSDIDLVYEKLDDIANSIANIISTCQSNISDSISDIKALQTDMEDIKHQIVKSCKTDTYSDDIVRTKSIHTKHSKHGERPTHSETVAKETHITEDITRLNTRFKSCKDFAKSNVMSGVYTIYPSAFPMGIKVYCDLKTNGGGWTVFQRRQDGSVDFFRDWNDYKQGFGDLNGEFWMSSEFVHKMTIDEPRKLRIDMMDWEGKVAYVKYSSFRIMSEGQMYTLLIAGYTGTVRDALLDYNGSMFSTKDKDNQGKGFPKLFTSAWWFNDVILSNLNGVYYRAPISDFVPNYIMWSSWKRTPYSYTLTFVEMKFQ